MNTRLPRREARKAASSPLSTPVESPPPRPTGVSQPREVQPARAPKTHSAASRYPALAHVGSQARFWSVAIAGLALDLWSKDWAFHTLRQGGHRSLIPHVFELQTMLNDGALFGIGSGHTGLFLLASLLALALVLWMFAQSSPRRRALQLALGAILAGALGNMYDRMFVKLVDQPVQTGAYPIWLQYVGEEDGRIKLTEYPPHADGLTRIVDEAPASVGFVRDFIKIPTTVPRWSWIPARLQGREAWPWVFNVADALLVCGVVILAIHLWRDRKPREAQPCATRARGPGFSVDSSDRTA